LIKTCQKKPLEEIEEELENLSFKLQTQFMRVSTMQKRKEKKELKTQISKLRNSIKPGLPMRIFALSGVSIVNFEFIPILSPCSLSSSAQNE